MEARSIQNKVRIFQNHFLNDAYGSERPCKIIVFDTETKHKDDEKYEHHYMDFAYVDYFERSKDGVISRDTWQLFTNNIEMWKYITSKAYDKSTLYVFGHNVYFDLQASGFFDYATQTGWKLKFVYDKGLTFILSIFQGKKKIKIISTTNFYDFSLAKVGEMLGIEKMKIDFDRDSDEYKKAYCRNDVVITREALLNYLAFIDTHDMGSFAMTKASQAFNAYRHRFMRNKICVHTEDDIVELERKSYLGGRNEAFEIGDLQGGPFYHYDINSMYPSVMLKERYPTRLVDTAAGQTTNEVYDFIQGFCAIAEVELETNEPVYGIRRNGKIIFPIGKLKTVLPTGSLKYAIEHDHIKKINTVVYYEWGYIFKDYVEYFYNLKSKYKAEGNEVYTRIVKIFLNSLYGKFGQKNSVDEVTYNEDNEGYYRIENFDEVTHEKWTETELLHTNIVQNGEEEGKNSFVAIPSHVTDYARLLLWSLIKMVGYNNVLYCDTDSIKIREKDKDKITYKIDNYELGALSLEDITEKFTIYGCKDYSTEKIEKIKGVPKNYTRINTNTFLYKTFLRMNTHLRKEIIDHYLIGQVLKTNKRNYDKGIVTNDGRVHPYRLKDW